MKINGSSVEETFSVSDLVSTTHRKKKYNIHVYTEELNFWRLVVLPSDCKADSISLLCQRSQMKKFQ